MTPAAPAAGAPPVIFIDPLTGEKIRVQSVYYPSSTLLTGKPYTRANEQLGQRQPRNGAVTL